MGSIMLKALALQTAMPVLIFGFGVLALRVAPRPGPPQTTAWFLTGVTFTLEGALALLHATAAIVAVGLGSETGFYRAYLKLLPAGNDARSLLVLGFAAGLTWVLTLGRPAPPARVTVTASLALMVVGFAIGLTEPPIQPRQPSDLSLLSILSAATAILLFVALYRGMVRKTVDRLLWTALALYAMQQLLSSNVLALAPGGFGRGWAPPLRIVMWSGLVSYLLMLACSVRHLQVTRATGSDREPSLHQPPGHHILNWASFLFSRRDVEEVIEPAITDMRIEYSDALVAGNRAHAGWIRIRGTYAILAAATLLVVARTGKLFVTVWRLISKAG